ncbi:hypothetical protein D3C76_1835990 [compost metagenome]
MPLLEHRAVLHVRGITILGSKRRIYSEKLCDLELVIRNTPNADLLKQVGVFLLVLNH